MKYMIQKYQEIIEINRVGCLHTDNTPEFKIAELIDKYNVNEITTNDFEFYKKNHLNFSYNAANVGNFIFDSTKNWINKPSYTGFAIGYGLDSILGPVELKYSWSPESRNSNFWVNVGFIF